MTKPFFQPLAEQNNIFYRCVEDSSEAIMISDVRGVLFYVNKAWQRIYGYSAEEAIGRTPRMLRSKHQHTDFYREMWTAISNPRLGYWKGELVNVSKSGKEVPVLLTITPYRDAHNQVQGYMGIALDMTQKRELEAQIIRQDRLASVGLLASGLAHEIGTPLGVIRGRAEYLAFLSGSDERLKSGLEIIVTQIDRISRLIYSLLNLARAEKSETTLAIVPAEIVRQVLVLTEQKLANNQIEVMLNISDHVRVIAERDKLTQVILNLVINAIHAIETRGDGPRKISFFAVENTDGWDLQIQDTGTGISKKNMNNLFKPFFTTKDVGQGTGLGLAIALQIVQSWGGQIQVTSEENVGTTFHLLLKKALL